MFRTSNPAMNPAVFARNRSYGLEDTMTVQGTVNKCFILFFLFFYFFFLLRLHQFSLYLSLVVIHHFHHSMIQNNYNISYLLKLHPFIITPNQVYYLVLI